MGRAASDQSVLQAYVENQWQRRQAQHIGRNDQGRGGGAVAAIARGQYRRQRPDGMAASMASISRSRAEICNHAALATAVRGSMTSLRIAARSTSDQIVRSSMGFSISPTVSATNNGRASPITFKTKNTNWIAQLFQLAAAAGTNMPSTRAIKTGE